MKNIPFLKHALSRRRRLGFERPTEIEWIMIARFLPLVSPRCVVFHGFPVKTFR
jgi:hypothetical protein